MTSAADGVVPEIGRARRAAFAYGVGLAIAALASWLRVAVAGSFRIDTGKPIFFIASAVLGVGLAIAGVSAVRFIALAEALPREVIRRWAVLANLPVVVAAPLTSTDFFHYLACGRVQVLGMNPLAVPPNALGADPLLELVSPRWAVRVTPYGPLTQLAFRVASQIGDAIGMPFGGSAVAFKLMMAGCQVATVLLAARLAARRPELAGNRALAALAFCPILAWEIAGQGHNDGILVLAIMVFVAAVTSGRALVATVAIAAGTAAKITLAPLLGLWLLFLLRTKGARAVAHALIAVAIGALVMVPFISGFQGFGPLRDAIGAAAVSHSLGDFFQNVLAPFGPEAQAIGVRVSFFAVCLPVCALAFANAVRARAPAALLRGAMLFLLAWDLTIPQFQPWYVPWLFPFLVVERDVRWQRVIVLYGAWSAMEWAAPIDPFSTMAVNVFVVIQVVRLLRAGGLAVREDDGGLPVG